MAKAQKILAILLELTHGITEAIQTTIRQEQAAELAEATYLGYFN